jgi:sorbitol/mannitol transport system permease protein
MVNKKVKRQLTNGVSIFIALLWVFPIFYMVVSSFKTETQVIVPGLIFSPTVENYAQVISPVFYSHLANSLVITLGTVLVSSVLAVTASYGIVFTPLKNPNGVYFWFVSTTFLPAIAVIVPVYLVFQRLRILDTQLGLVVLYTGAGVPLMIWMITNFFKEIPKEIVESADIDGSSRLNTFFTIMLPLVRNGLISSAMLVFIITWNEFFFAVTIAYTSAATLPIYMSKFMTQQGYFWGKMCAAATVVVIIPVVMGFFTQKTLIRGLTTGSVKG